MRDDDFKQVSDTNRDIMNMLSTDFGNKWQDTIVRTSAMFINFEQLWDQARTEIPELIGTWKDVKIEREPVIALLGEVAEPLIEYIELSRRSSILQHLNLFQNLGYLEMIFDIDNMRETYRLTDKTTRPDLIGRLKELVDVYESI